MKKILLTLLAVAMATAAFSGQAATEYGINVGGVEVTSSNYNNVTGGNISGGTVKYDPTNKILTLTSVSISRTGGDNYCVHNRSVAGLTINFEGTSTLSSNLANAIHCDKNTYIKIYGTVNAKMTAGTNNRRGVIYANDGVQVRFRGPGTLNITGTTSSSSSAYTDGFEGKGKSNSCSLYFESDIVVNANVSGYGIDKFGTVNISSSDVKLNYGTNYALYDVYSFSYSNSATCVTPCDGSFNDSNGYFVGTGYTHFTDKYGIILYPSWFPDDNFRNYLLGKASSGEHYLTPTQLQNLTSIDVSNRNIYYLNGIDHLIYVTYLDCSNNHLSALYVKPLTRLQTLKCQNNQLQNSFELPSTLQTIYCGGNPFSTWGVSDHSALKTVDVSNCTSMTSLSCNNNALTSLNVSGCTALTTVSINNNNFTSLPTLPSTLETLYCSGNQLTSLSSLPSSVKYLICGGNKFTSLTLTGRNNLRSLNISSTTTLTSLDCSSNMLSYLNVDGCSALTSLDCRSNSLSELNYLPSSLKTLYCQGNHLSSLTLPTSLQTLYCGANNFSGTLSLTGRSALKTLNVQNNTGITTLNCYSNALTSLDVSGCTALTTLNCYSNQLTSLGSLLPTSLQSIDCSSNKLSGTLSVTGRTALKTLNVSNNTSLTTLNCYSNALTSLNVNGCTSLTTLNCYSNQLTSLGTLPNSLQSIDCSSNKLSGTLSVTGRSALKTLNVSNNTSLTTLNCYSNALTSLNVNGCTSLTTLYCYSNQLTSLGTLPSTLTTLSCYSNKLTSLGTLPNSLTSLYCYNNQLTSLGTLPSSLQTLYCGSNNFSGTLNINNHYALKTLDVSNNTSLTKLNCYGNALTTLNLSDCDALSTLICYSNQLTSLGTLPNSLQTIDCSGNEFTYLNINGRSALQNLDVSNNDYLTTLNCYSNALTSIDVEGCSSLNSLNCYGNALTTLDLSDCDALSTLICYNNQLTSLGTLPNSLQSINCSGNQLTSIGTLPTSLQTLNCSNNQLTSLSAQNCNELSFLNIQTNQINSTEMGNLVNSLRTIPEGSTGRFIVYSVDNASAEGNVITAAQINTAAAKRWGLKMIQDGSQVDIVPNEPAGLLGDINRDGKVDVTDVNIVINVMLGKVQASNYPGNLDVNHSGSIDVSDVNKIINIMLGKEPGGNENDPEPVVVTYDYTTAASLQALGFSNEIPSPGEQSLAFFEAKELSDQYATMAYNNFILYPDGNNCVLWLLERDALYTSYGIHGCGQVDWTAKGSIKIKKIVIRSYDSTFANYVRITSNDTGATLTVEDDVTTCTFSAGGVNSATISAGTSYDAAIKTITVTYQ